MSASPSSPATSTIERIDFFATPSLEETPADQLRAIREAANGFKEWFRLTGTVTGFASRSLVTLPYPKRFGLWEACSVPVPYVWMTNRMFVIQWEADGQTKTLLAEPSDYDLGVDTPFLKHAIDRLPMGNERALDTLFKRHGHVEEHLAAMGLAPEDIDFLAFDHLHTQDIRRLVGTTAPAPDLGFTEGPVPAMFPNARLIVQRDELEHVKDVHPFQARFHQSWTYTDTDEDRLLLTEGDVLLGPGVALLRTPGHTLGNHTLVVNTERGIFTSSENGIAVECYAPERSKIPGVAKWAAEWGYEVVMNFNTPEYASWQYNSMIKEKLVADTIPGTDLPQVMPSSELTRHRLAPGIKPAYEHGEVSIGRIVAKAAAS